MKITEEQRTFLNTIFQKMIAEQESDYVYKDELIRNYISLIIHESLKLEPEENFEQNKMHHPDFLLCFWNYWKDSSRLKPPTRHSN